MIERDFIAQKTKEYHIKKYLENKLNNVGLSQITLKKIPLGEKITIFTSRPGLIVGTKGSNIKDLTKYLKKEFKLENPQIEINEIKKIFLDANVVAEKIASSLERFGSARFKGIAHKMIQNIIQAGALGVEIILSGKIPGARAKSWRFYQGYLKKCGDTSLTQVRRSKKIATLKSGIVGIKVSIMPSDVKLPDKIKILDEPIEIIEEIKEETKTKKTKKKATKKKEGKVKEKKEGNMEAKKEKTEIKETPKKETTKTKETKKEEKVVEEKKKELEEPVEKETSKEESNKDNKEEQKPTEEDTQKESPVEPETKQEEKQIEKIKETTQTQEEEKPEQSKEETKEEGKSQPEENKEEEQSKKEPNEEKVEEKTKSNEKEGIIKKVKDVLGIKKKEEKEAEKKSEKEKKETNKEE